MKYFRNKETGAIVPVSEDDDARVAELVAQTTGPQDQYSLYEQTSAPSVVADGGHLADGLDVETFTLTAPFSSPDSVVAVREDHVVTFQGKLVVAGGVVVGTSVLHTFSDPVWYPKQDVIIPIFESDGAGEGTLTITAADGVIKWTFGATGTFSLTGAGFVDPYRTR